MQDMTVVHCRLCAPRVQSIHDCNLHAAGSLFALWSIVFFSMENLNLLLTFILLTCVTARASVRTRDDINHIQLWVR